MKLSSLRALASPIFPSLLRISQVAWRRAVESSRLLRGYLKKVILVATDGLTKEACIAAYLFSREVVRMEDEGRTPYLSQKNFHLFHRKRNYLALWQ